MNMKRMRIYKEALLELGFEQLDVYEYPERDVLRIRSISNGKVLFVRLPKHRKDMNIEEFKSVVRREIKRHEKRKNV